MRHDMFNGHYAKLIIDERDESIFISRDIEDPVGFDVIRRAEGSLQRDGSGKIMAFHDLGPRFEGRPRVRMRPHEMFDPLAMHQPHQANDSALLLLCQVSCIGCIVGVTCIDHRIDHAMFWTLPQLRRAGQSGF